MSQCLRRVKGLSLLIGHFKYPFTYLLSFCLHELGHLAAIDETREGGDRQYVLLVMLLRALLSVCVCVCVKSQCTDRLG